MPFTDRFDAIWEDVIRTTVIAHGDECARADDVFRPGVVMDDVRAKIESADYLIADLSTQRANVYYELGLAHALKKPVILLTQEINDVPFDLRHQRILPYTDSVAGAQQLRQVLAKALLQV